GGGKVSVQAQSDELELTGQRDVSVSSVAGKVLITAGEELTLSCGGGYIRLKGGKIELGCPGNILLKSANVQKMSAASFDVSPPELPRGCGEFFILHSEKTGEIMPFSRYRITTSEGRVFEGSSDKDGKTDEIFTAAPDNMVIEFPDSLEETTQKEKTE
ncbi:DUF2345 domain-containing protein, partial [Brenneria sp. L4-2C]|uniref:DUF2345 domain-containing protein n=2 Tax=unclassified Brenneria TaxID=2634434 RepID=UPI0029C2B40C